MTPAQARATLAMYAGGRKGRGNESDQSLLRRARRATHPSRNTGDQHDWNKVVAAAHTLGLVAQ